MSLTALSTIEKAIVAHDEHDGDMGPKALSIAVSAALVAGEVVKILWCTRHNAEAMERLDGRWRCWDKEEWWPCIIVSAGLYLGEEVTQ